MTSSFLIACHECDLLNRIPEGFDSGTARCARCYAVLARRKPDTVNRTLALCVTGFILFAIANAFPFLTLKMEAQIQETTLVTGIRELYGQGMWVLASVVLFTTVLAPLVHLSGIFTTLLLAKLKFQLPGSAAVLRFVQRSQPWAMMEVFMLGILVSTVKLAKMAKIIPGTGLVAFLALIFVMAAMMAAFDAHAVWERMEARR